MSTLPMTQQLLRLSILLLLLAALRLPAGATALEGFDWRVEGGETVFRILFDRPATLRVHDEQLTRRYFYLDFYNVDPPGEDRSWEPASGGIMRVRQLYYAKQGVLRFVFYMRQDVWFAVQTSGLDHHEVHVRPIEYAEFGRVTGDLGGARKRIVIDPGHGGKPGDAEYHMGAETSRKIGGRTIYEKELTLQIAQRLEALIAKVPNLESTMTRTKDVYVSLPDRIKIANESAGDLFLSIHLNASGSRSKTAQGFEVYYLSDGTKEVDRELLQLENDGVTMQEMLSQDESLRELLRALVDETMGLRQAESKQLCDIIGLEFKTLGPFRQHYRGVKSAPFRVLMNFEMPSALVECGFLDNPAEAEHLVAPATQQRIANLLFNAINRYFAFEDAGFRPSRIPVAP
jgi:N-acetylmuramoyl-L-alanine amidase